MTDREIERTDAILEAAAALLRAVDEEIEKKEEKPLPPNVLESVEHLRKFVKRAPASKRGSFGPAFRKIIMDELRKIPSGQVAVLLGGGVDATALLCGLLALKRQVIAYSFTLNDRESTDFKIARETAKRLNVPFVGIKLPSDVNTLKREVPRMIRRYNVVKKTRVECLWPMMHAFRHVKERMIVTGLTAGAFFGLRRQIEQEYRDSSKPLDDIRDAFFEKPDSEDPGGIFSTNAVAKDAGKVLFHPFFSANKKLRALLKGTTWRDLNKPQQKQPIRDAFAEEFKPLSLKRHVNFQVGDSGIADMFEKLLKTDLNRSGHKVVAALYRELANDKSSR